MIFVEFLRISFWQNTSWWLLLIKALRALICGAILALVCWESFSWIRYHLQCRCYELQKLAEPSEPLRHRAVREVVLKWILSLIFKALIKLLRDHKEVWKGLGQKGLSLPVKKIPISGFQWWIIFTGLFWLISILYPVDRFFFLMSNKVF